MDLEHTYIDGTKIEANANKYTWVWKKSCIKNRGKLYGKISELIDSMNAQVLNLLGLKFETREEYAIEYLENLLDKYENITGLDKSIDTKPYASDMDCFVPLMEKFNATYSKNIAINNCLCYALNPIVTALINKIT